MMSIVMATYWLTVFHFASREAGTITPTWAATARRPVTASSRPMMTTTTHAATLSIASSETSAAATSSLSAMGSSSVPSVVTWLRRRASVPSAQSVSDARMKMPAAMTAWTREDEIRKTISSGTATIRVSVSPIGGFTSPPRGTRGSAPHYRGPETTLSTSGRYTGTSVLASSTRHAATSAPRPVRVRCRAHDESCARRPTSLPYSRARRAASSAARVNIADGWSRRRHSVISPAQTWSSRETAPRSPAQSSVTSRPRPSAQATAAVALTSAATPTAAAARAASRARVPLLVVNTITRPRTRSGVQSTGELPRSNPAIGSPRRSPAVSAVPRGSVPARRRASSGSATGTIPAQPLPSAVTIVVDARSTSMTRTAAPSTERPVRASAVGATSTRTPSAPAVSESPDPEPQGVEIDEALGVALAVDGVGLEGGEVGTIEGTRRPPAQHGDVALVELEAHRPRHVAHAVVHQPLKRLPLRREPEAVVDHLGVPGHEAVAQVEHLAVERDRFQRSPRDVQDRPTGRLVDAARLHADEAVLDEVHAPDAVLAAHAVEPLEQRDRPQSLAIDGDGVAGLEVDQHLDGDVGRLFRGIREDEHLVRRRRPRVLQDAALVGDVEEVAIRAVGSLGRHRYRDVVTAGEVDERGARGEIPLAPGRDHAQVRRQCRVRQFEAHLVVPLARGPVGDGVGALLQRDLHLGLGDERPRDRGAEQVAALVDGRGAQHREDEVADEFFPEVDDVHAPSPGAERLVPDRDQLLALPQVGAEGHHLAAVPLDQPAQDDGRVEPARVGQDDELRCRGRGARRLRHRRAILRGGRGSRPSARAGDFPTAPAQRTAGRRARRR